MKLSYHFLLFLSLNLLPLLGQANHLAGGYISYVCLSEGNYEVTLNVFQDCLDENITPSQSVRVVPSCDFNFFSSSLDLVSNEVLTEFCADEEANAVCNGGTLPSYRLLKYRGNISVSTSCESFRFFWKFNYRTESVNIEPGLWSLYTHTVVYPQAGLCNDSPLYLSPDVIQSCIESGDQIFLDPIDPEGDSLYFSLVSALYSPSGNSFAPLAYTPGYTYDQPVPGAVLDPLTGLFSYDGADQGRYSIAMQINEYGPSGLLQSQVHIDFLVIEELCANTGLSIGQDLLFNASENVELIGPKEIELCQNQPFCVDYVYALDLVGLDINISDDLNQYLSDVQITLIPETDSLRLQICGTSPQEQVNAILHIYVQDDHCPYPNFLVTEFYLHTLNATAPSVFIELFTEDLFMTNPVAGESYQWFQNGQAIPGATASSLQIGDTGGMEYYLEVTSVSGCTGVSNVIYIPVSVDEQMKLNFMIRPNPVHNMLEVSLSDARFPLSMNINDIQGRKMKEFNFNALPITMDLSHLEPGAYVIHSLDAHGRTGQMRFIKE